MITTTTLTESEVKLIEANRLKLEARKLEVEAAAETTKSNAITEANNSLTLTVNRANHYFNIITNFEAELYAISNLVTSTVGEDVISQRPSYYQKNYDESYESYKNEHIQLEALTSKVNTKVVWYKGYQVNAKEHVVYSNSSSHFSSSIKSRNWEMQISGPKLTYKEEGKFYKNAKSVIKKIDEIIAAEEQTRVNAAKLVNVVEQTKEKYTTLYPTATVTVEQSGESVRMSYNKTKYVEVDLMKIVFANGVTVVYKIYNDGSLGRKEITFGNIAKTADQLMEILSKIGA